MVEYLTGDARNRIPTPPVAIGAYSNTADTVHKIEPAEVARHVAAFRAIKVGAPLCV